MRPRAGVEQWTANEWRPLGDVPTVALSDVAARNYLAIVLCEWLERVQVGPSSRRALELAYRDLTRSPIDLMMARSDARLIKGARASSRRRASDSNDALVNLTLRSTACQENKTLPQAPNRL
jgi:hypothetical protein